MKIGLLFPGQGSQMPGMGQSLYEKFPETREIFAQANEILGFNLQEKMFHGTLEDLKATAITQPAIFTVSAAAFKVLSQHCPQLILECLYTAGHSLGEYSAFFASGAFDFQTGIKLVKYRGAFIQEACNRAPGSMAAVLGVIKADLEKICNQVESSQDFCEMVNFNSPTQIVVAGTLSGVEKLMAELAHCPGAKAIPLAVSGAFHSRLMKEASNQMAKVLEQTPIKNATIPVITNWDAQATIESHTIKKKLTQQIDHPVLWEDSIKKMIQDGVNIFIELGPGKVLTGLVKRIDRKKTVYNVEDAESFYKLKETLFAQK